MRSLPADGQYLPSHSIGLHQGEAFVHFLLAEPRSFVALRAGVRVSVTLRQVQIFVGPKMRMNVDAHALFCLGVQLCAKKNPCRGERPRAKKITTSETTSASHHYDCLP